MKTLWILAAAATFAACHNRSDEDMGAAPDRGDSTATAPVDTSAAQPTTKYTSTAQPSVPSSDSSMTQPTAPSTGYDTTSTSQPTAPSAGVDTTSTAVPPTATDTTMAAPTTDSSSTQK